MDLISTIQGQVEVVQREYHDLRLGNAALHTQRDQVRDKMEVLTTKLEASEEFIATLDRMLALYFFLTQA